ncbi:hypothetical protein CS060_12765 [Anoxybacillus flavithermus]|uniref:Uncharacterized protein n=1 Tax=Anoxybacillus flavithermus TaxID=33934 RepID=A0A2G5RMH0_9BACL|nr:hypothetical protein CS060_12765 [Anoxybacillus flavithermus]
MEPVGWKVPHGKSVEPTLYGRLCKHKPSPLRYRARGGRLAPKKVVPRNQRFSVLFDKGEKAFFIFWKGVGW